MIGLPTHMARGISGLVQFWPGFWAAKWSSCILHDPLIILFSSVWIGFCDENLSTSWGANRQTGYEEFLEFVASDCAISD